MYEKEEKDCLNKIYPEVKGKKEGKMMMNFLKL